MILLTDDEIKEAQGQGYSDWESVASAQLKKVVEWLDRPCHEHSGDVLHPHRRCGVCLQALKKEAGI